MEKTKKTEGYPSIQSAIAGVTVFYEMDERESRSIKEVLDSYREEDA